MKKILFSILILIAIVGIVQYGFMGKKESSTSSVASASALKIGDTIPTFKINDQFEKTHVISPESKTIFVAESRGTSVIIREYLLTKDVNFLAANKAHYIADISGMPSLISEYVALPKMKKYPFSILLVDEEQAKSFTTKDDEITVYTVSNGKISDVKFIKTTEELAAIFN